MTNALVLLGHADARSFNTALARAYAEGLAAEGVRVETLAIASLRFDPVLHAGFEGDQPLEPDLVRVQQAIERADHLVWAFPTYWASPPAIVRGLVDRVFLPGWAFRYPGGNALPEGLLGGRSARVIATMDSPSWWYTLAHRRSLHATMGRATLAFCGIRPVRFSVVHRVRALDAPTRERWLERLRAVGRADARRSSRMETRPIGATAERTEQGRSGAVGSRDRERERSAAGALVGGRATANPPAVSHAVHDEVARALGGESHRVRGKREDGGLGGGGRVCSSLTTR